VALEVGEGHGQVAAEALEGPGVEPWGEAVDELPAEAGVADLVAVDPREELPSAWVTQ
jgi:hypothetical protein